MLRVLRVHAFRHLYGAQIVALLGTGLATVALGLMAYDLAGDHAGQILGTALAIKMVAYVLVAPVATALVAALPRRAVLVGSDVLRLAVALCLPAVTEVWQVFVLVFVLQAASATFTPTFQSVIPDVLSDEDDYTEALSLSRLAGDLEQVVSPTLAAAMLVFVSSSTLFYGTAVGFAGSAALVLSVVIPRVAAPEAGPTVAGGAPATFWRRVIRGAALFVATPALRPVLALNLVVATGGAFVIVQTVVVVRSVFGLPESAVAWVLGANGLGSMAAALLLPRVLRVVAERRVMLAGAAGVTVATALIPAALSIADPAWGVAGVCILWVVIGLAWASAETPVARIIRRSVGRPDLPAVFAAQFSLSHACWLVTYPLVGWLGSASLTLTAAVLAVIAGAATVVAAVAWPRGATSVAALRITSE